MDFHGDDEVVSGGSAERSAEGTAPVGVVVIGRNEGDRVLKALESVPRHVEAVVYVDSDSTDGSRAIVEAAGYATVHLTPPPALCAARGRNAGFEHVSSSAGTITFVQFVDGDCVLRAGWIESAVTYFAKNANVGVVAGELSELGANRSIFRRILDLEWRGQLGAVPSTGGIFMARRAVLESVGGFDPSLRLGEEAELCGRVRDAGWQIHRISAPMAIHDSGFRGFADWWKRGVRSGEAIMIASASDQPAIRSGGRRRILSTLAWGAFLPLVMLSSALLGIFVHWNAYLVLAVLAFGATLQVARISASARRKYGWPHRHALLYAVHVLFAKVPESLGVFRQASRRER